MAELQAIEAGLRDLEARKEAVGIKLDLLKKAIGTDIQIDMPPNSAHQSGMNGHAAEVPKVSHDGGSSQIEGGGFREAIRGVLSSKGMRPREVHAELVKRGVPFNGKVEGPTRTNNELWRMAKKGQIRKRAGLYYAQEAA
jgi:hypothetical protein